MNSENMNQRWPGMGKIFFSLLICAWMMLTYSTQAVSAALLFTPQLKASCTVNSNGSQPIGRAAALSLEEVRWEFESAIENNETQAAFTTSADFTLGQLYQQLSQAAENQGMLYTGKCTYQKQVLGEQAEYTFYFTDASLLKVKRLKNTAAAYKAALKALKNSDYTTRFYSDSSYYSIFYLMLQQHPEYNYNTLVWKNSNGTYGYRRSKELTGSEQNAKMRAADHKAEAFVKNRIKKNMTAAQKLQAIHDYLIHLSAYDYEHADAKGYEDSFTAYGALVKKKAVCQGYTAAFNLIAQKAGFSSIAVCGLANRSSHTWNYVRIGSRSRYIDCTWDKTLQQGDAICYDYFNVGSAVMRKSHAWDAKKFAAKYLKYCKYLK